jgi:hypothetical protein
MNAARRPAAPSVEPQPLRRRSSLAVAAWPEKETVDDPVSQAAWRAARFSRILRPVTFRLPAKAPRRGSWHAASKQGPGSLRAWGISPQFHQVASEAPQPAVARAENRRRSRWPRDARKLACRKMRDKQPPVSGESRPGAVLGSFRSEQRRELIVDPAEAPIATRSSSPAFPPCFLSRKTRSEECQSRESSRTRASSLGWAELPFG